MTTFDELPGPVTECGIGCEFAEPLSASGGEWIWCHRPGAVQRLCSWRTPCRYFAARGRLTAEPIGTGPAAEEVSRLGHER
ncbi:MAG: hypothetical protein JSR48_10660 [Verrucomicrobia bacterium]|nr:hypothetical protein [Verrucomicrobiota bacterium]